MIDEALSLLDRLLRYVESGPLTDDCLPTIVQAIGLIRCEVERARVVTFAEGYQCGYDRGEADAEERLDPAIPETSADDSLLEQLDAEVSAGRAVKH